MNGQDPSGRTWDDVQDVAHIWEATGRMVPCGKWVDELSAKAIWEAGQPSLSGLY